jgi:succinate dehydrogenase flavin-adding protein (antitoxin of CptAB toxin-antitoxin module)
MDSTERHRLKWKCRRGRLELDLVLEKFLETVADRDVPALAELLDLPDNDLWDIVCGRSEQYDFHLRDAVARLRTA